MYIMYNFGKQIIFQMNTFRCYVLLFMITSLGYSQDVKNGTIKGQSPESAIPDSIVQLDEVIITNVKMTEEEKERIKMLILQRRVFRAYPFAKIAAEKLVVLNKNLSVLKSEREKRKYIKIVEKYVEDEFEEKLKKLSRKDGQVLVKLMNRQTGTTTFALIKDLKSGWKAFWFNQTAKLFNINLKTSYEPENNLEDYQIELILLRAFAERKLEQLAPFKKIDIMELSRVWESRRIASEAEKK